MEAGKMQQAWLNVMLICCTKCNPQHCIVAVQATQHTGNYRIHFPLFSVETKQIYGQICNKLIANCID